MYYLDTSYIAKCYLGETGSAKVLEWLEGKSGLCCSLHGRIELWSAVTRHRQEGRLDLEKYHAVLHSIQADEDSVLWTWLPISKEIIRLACSTLEAVSNPPFLRSADALHLASAACNGFKSVYSHDIIMLQWAKRFRLKGIDIIDT